MGLAQAWSAVSTRRASASRTTKVPLAVATAWRSRRSEPSGVIPARASTAIDSAASGSPALTPPNSMHATLAGSARAAFSSAVKSAPSCQTK
jgi:hypothetical protein